MNKRNMQKWFMMTPFFLAICMLVGCAAKEVPVYGDPQTGVILQYRMPEGQVLKYDSWGETHQVADVMGQSIETDISSTSAFTIESKGQAENNHQLTITIDGMSLQIQSTTGELEPDMSTVIGKSFDMVFSFLGKEVELIGADSIEYELGPEGTRSISSGFQDIFPDLAGRPVKIGDSWPAESTITEKSETSETVVRSSGTNTLVGFETIDGIECAKIQGEGTGTIESKGEQQGVELITTGEISGTSTWYFDYKEGIFIKQILEGKVEGTIDVPSQGLQIPYSRESSGELKLIK
jgi:hypothetical protein